MKCPRDHIELSKVKLEKKSCWQCPSCQGYFIGLAGPRLQGITLSRLNPKSTPCILPLGEEALKSPATGQAMKHFVYKGINLDYCKSSNSVWMDKGELDSVAEKFVVKRKKAKSSSEYGFVDGVADVAFEGVFEFVGHAIGSLFDGL